MGAERRNSDSNADDIPAALTSAVNGASPAREQSSRSSSPSKRRASEMDSEQKDRLPVKAEADDKSPNKGSSSGTTSAEESPGTAEDASSATDADSSESRPSYDDQVETVITEVTTHDQKEGQVGYIVARAWLGRVIARSKYNGDMGPFPKEALEGEVGPVNNESIIDTAMIIDATMKDESGRHYIPLKKGLRSGEDLEILPEAAWEKVVKWYGMSTGQRPILRYSHEVSLPDAAGAREFQYELYPPLFTLRKLVTDKQNVGLEKLAPAPRVLSSSSQRYQSFLKIVKRQLGIPLGTKVKISRVVDLEPTTEQPTQVSTAILSPPASRDNSPNRPRSPALTKLITLDGYKSLDDNDQIDALDKISDESMNEKYNGSLNLDALGLRVDQVLIVRETSNKAKLDLSKKSALKSGAKDTDSVASSGRASPANIITRGRNRATGRTKGTVGLTNLGNTCYMNSALQCMRAVQELSLYFLSDQWSQELNRSNPLGHRGQVATSYAQLLHEIYEKAGTSCTPRAFKATVGRFAPMFSGYGQQDSQEFMSFLLDGLHEDLNRIHNKPYRENPDSDDSTVHDPEAIAKLGDVYRENHLARNSSVVTDLFSGFYKNKLVCPTCSKVSITFDPFSLLTLQLPMSHRWEFQFVYIPVNDKPIKITVDNSKGATVGALKDFVASRIPSVDSSRLLLVEVFSNKIYRTMEDRHSIVEANIQPKDDMIFYELESAPTNYPVKQKKYRSMLDVDSNEEDETESSDNGVQLVMATHRTTTKSSYSTSKTPTLYPSFITLTKEDANDYTEIYRNLLRCVANMTSRNLNEIVQAHEEQGEQEDEQPTEIDDKSGDDGVNTASLASDSYVDVSMVGTDEADRDTNQPRTTPKYAFLKRGAPIPAVLLNLFELSYGHGTEPIQSGWSAEYGKTFQTLKSRIPKPVSPATPEDSASSPAPTEDTEASDESTQETSEAQEEASEKPEATVSYEANEDTSELSSMSFVKPGSSRNKKGRGKGRRGPKTYGKAHRQAQFARKTSVEPAAVDDGDGLLIRPNDFLVVDWSPEAYDQLFGDYGGVAKDDARIFDDPAMEQSKKLREGRKKRGVALEDCFAETSKEEELTEENAWYCNKCKELRQATKKLEIWTCPDILVVHLKRFSSGRSFRDKIDVVVDFPIEGLDLTGRVGVDEGKPLIYDLFGVDNHYGGLGGGHYTAYAKNFYDQQWYEYNDSHVSKCNPDSVVSAAAYLLFYRRRTDHPLGPAPLQKLVNKALYDQDPDSESSTTDEDSGNGQRPADDSSSRNGSGASHGQDHAAARQRRGDGLVGPSQRSTQGLGKRSSEESLPGYQEATIDEDETLGMEGPPWTTTNDGTVYGAHSNWSFNNLDRNYSDASDDSKAAQGNVSDDEFPFMGPYAPNDSFAIDNDFTPAGRTGANSPVGETVWEDDEAMDIGPVRRSVETEEHVTEIHVDDDDTSMHDVHEQKS